jgi:single-strand DNA-binding protein
MMNNLNFTGRIGKDCETRFTSEGDPITSFTAAMDSGYGDKKITTWLNCSMFGKRGESVAPYLLKGTQIAVSGEFTCREYTDKSGNKRTSNDVRVNDLTLIGVKSYKPTKRGLDAPPSFEEEDIPF